jgi:hypothetical protein
MINMRNVFALIFFLAAAAFGQAIDVNAPGFWKSNTDMCVKRQVQDPVNEKTPRETLQKYCDCITGELRKSTNNATWADKSKFVDAAQSASRICIQAMDGGTADRGNVTVEQKIQDASNLLNKSLPRTLDEYTRQDTTAAGPGRKLTNFYTLIKIVPGIRDGEYINKTIRPITVSTYCSDPGMEFFRKNSVTVTYSYRDANGKFVSRFDVGTRDCR